MANPYHDAEGKFCSRAEMQTSIQQQIQQGNFDKAAEMETELKAYDKETALTTEQLYDWGNPPTTACVDESGQPLTVFHGSTVDFDEWNDDFTGGGEDAFGSGFYFTTSEDTAATYGTVTKKVKLNIENPIRINAENLEEAQQKLRLTRNQVEEMFKKMPNIYTTGDENEDNPLGDLSEEYWDKDEHTPAEVDAMIRKVAEKHFTNGTTMNDLERYYENSGGVGAFRKALKETTGHDGVVAHFPTLGQSHWIAWDKTQIVEE